MITAAVICARVFLRGRSPSRPLPRALRARRRAWLATLGTEFGSSLFDPTDNQFRYSLTTVPALAAAEYRDPALVRALSDSFLRDCDGMGDDALRRF